MSIPSLAPQPAAYTPFLEQTRLGDWNSRLVSVIGALSQQMHASRYVAVAVFTVANVVAFYAIRAFVSRLEPKPAAPSLPETDDGPNQDAKPLQSILCPILVGAADYGVNTALAKATHYSIHPFVLTAIAVAMSATYHFTRQSHIQPPASPVSSQPTHFPTSSSTPPRPPSVRTSSISPSPNPVALSPLPTVFTPQNQTSPVSPVMGPQPSDGVTAFHSSEPLHHSNVTIQTTNLSRNIDFYRGPSEEHAPPSASTNRRFSLNSEEDRNDGFPKSSDYDFDSPLRERSESESEVESHLEPYYHDADEEGDEEDPSSSPSLSRSSSRQSLGDNDLSEEGDEEDHDSSSNLSGSSSRQSLGDNNLLSVSETPPQTFVFLSDEEMKREIERCIEAGRLEEAKEATMRLPSEKWNEYFSKIAKAYFFQENFEQAIEILDTSIGSTEIKCQIYKEFARSYCLASKYEEAMQCIHKIVYDYNSLMETIFLDVAKEHLRNKDFEKAEATALYLKDKSKNSHGQICLLIGAAYIEEGKFDEAVKILDEITYHTTSVDKHFLKIARAYLDQGDLDNTDKILGKMKDTTDPIHKEFARLCCLKSKYEMASERIRKITHDYNSLMEKMFLDVAEEHLSNQNFEKAEAIALYLKDKLTYGHAQICLLIGAAYIEQGKFDEAVKILDQITYNTTRIDKHFLKIARAYLDQGDLDNTAKILGKMKDTTDPIHKEFARLCCLKSKYEMASERIRKITYDYNSLMEKIFLDVAKEHLRNKDFGKAEATAVYLKDTLPYSHCQICLLIGAAYIEQGKFDEAVKILEEITYNSVSVDKHFLKIAGAYLDQGDLDNTAKILGKMKDTTDPIHKEFARLCCLKSKYEMASERIRKITYDYKSLMEKIFLDVAEEHFKENNFEKAEATVLYLKSIECNCNSICLRMGAAYIERDELDKAANILEIINTDRRNELFLKLAKKYSGKGDLEKAVKYNAYNDNKKDAKDFYVELAQEYYKRRDNLGAFNVLRKIIEHGYLIDRNDKTEIETFIEKSNYAAAVVKIRSSSYNYY